MKFREILEHTLLERGIRMGQRDLSSADFGDMTIGFEFELSVNINEIDDDHFAPESREDTAYEYFTNNIWPNEGYSALDFIEDFFTSADQFIDHFDIKPKKDVEIEQLRTYWKWDKDFITLEYLNDNYTYDEYKFETEYEQAEQDKMMYRFDIWAESPDRDEGISTAIQYVNYIFSYEMPDHNFKMSSDYHGEENNITSWRIEPDESINMKPPEADDDYQIKKFIQDWNDDEDGAELISPPMPVEKGLRCLQKVFEIIKNNPALSTNSTTGLHINIGTWPNGEGLDLLKLSLISGDEYVLKMFERQDNKYAKPIIERLISFLEKTQNTDINSIQKEINKMLLTSGRVGKYQTINYGHFLDKGYIEFRPAGGQNYHLKEKEIINTVLRFVRSLNIASDANAYKDEYLSKLYTFVDEGKKRDVSDELYSLKQLGLTLEQNKIFTNFCVKNKLMTTVSLDKIDNQPEYIYLIIDKILRVDQIEKLTPDIVVILRKVYITLRKNFSSKLITLFNEMTTRLKAVIDDGINEYKDKQILKIIS